MFDTTWTSNHLPKRKQSESCLHSAKELALRKDNFCMLAVFCKQSKNCLFDFYYLSLLHRFKQDARLTVKTHDNYHYTGWDHTFFSISNIFFKVFHKRT